MAFREGVLVFSQASALNSRPVHRIASRPELVEKAAGPTSSAHFCAPMRDILIRFVAQHRRHVTVHSTSYRSAWWATSLLGQRSSERADQRTVRTSSTAP